MNRSTQRKKAEKGLDGVSIEQLLAEIDGCFTTIEEIQIPTLEDELEAIKKLCQAGFQLSHKVHKHLGLYQKVRE